MIRVTIHHNENTGAVVLVVVVVLALAWAWVRTAEYAACEQPRRA
jgi:hypothetical protein